MDIIQLQNQLLEAFREITMDESIELETPLKELSLDSLDYLELFFKIQGWLEVEVSQTRMQELVFGGPDLNAEKVTALQEQTVAQLADAIFLGLQEEQYESREVWFAVEGTLEIMNSEQRRLQERLESTREALLQALEESLGEDYKDGFLPRRTEACLRHIADGKQGDLQTVSQAVAQQMKHQREIL